MLRGVMRQGLSWDRHKPPWSCDFTDLEDTKKIVGREGEARGSAFSPSFILTVP